MEYTHYSQQTEDIMAIVSLLFTIGQAFGYLFVVSGLILFYKNAEDKTRFPISRALTTFIIGVCLLSLDLIVATTMETFSGTPAQDYSILAVNANIDLRGASYADNSVWKLVGEDALQRIFQFLYLFGVIAVLRGFFLFKKGGETAQAGHNYFSQGSIFFLSGVALINIRDVLEYFYSAMF